LLLYGQRDQRVTLSETQQIYQALAGPKQLVVFEQADHESYAGHDPQRWQEKVSSFLAP
jgi:esterase/lipase